MDYSQELINLWCEYKYDISSIFKLPRNNDNSCDSSCCFYPDKIPEIARGLGTAVRKLKAATEDIKHEILNPIEESDVVKDLKNTISDIDPSKEIERSLADLDPTADLKKSLTELDPTADLKKSFSDIDPTKEIEATIEEMKSATEIETEKTLGNFWWFYKSISMSEIIHFDEQAFLFFNNLGSSSWDNLWVLITGKLTWVPLYALLAYLLYRQLGIRRLGVVIVCIVLMITVTDQFTNLMKHSFERFRPCHNAELAGLFRPVDCEGRGRFGFTSAHASNSMALALFVGYLLKPSYKWIRPLLVFWVYWLDTAESTWVYITRVTLYAVL